MAAHARCGHRGGGQCVWPFRRHAGLRRGNQAGAVFAGFSPAKPLASNRGGVIYRFFGRPKIRCGLARRSTCGSVPNKAAVAAELEANQGWK